MLSVGWVSDPSVAPHVVRVALLPDVSIYMIDVLLPDHTVTFTDAPLLLLMRD